MERHVTDVEAGHRFREILREVQAGVTFVVTVDGRPVARIIPVEPSAGSADATEGS